MLEERREREHLLLAAGQRAGEDATACREAGKAGVHGVAFVLGTQMQGEVLLDGEGREDPASFGRQDDPRPGPSDGPLARGVAPGDVHLAGERGQQPGGDAARGGLSGTVRAEEGEDLAWADGEVDAVEDGGSVVSGVDGAEFEGHFGG